MVKWIFGLVVSVLVGQVVVSSFLVVLRKYLERREDEYQDFSCQQKLRAYLGIDFYPPLRSPERQVPPWLIGPAERLFFTIVVAEDISGGAVAMVAWIALKMVASRPYRQQRAVTEGMASPLPFEFAGLIGNLASMFFAMLGGLICKGCLPIVAN